MLDKRRDGNNDKAIGTTIIGDVKDKNAIIFDDEIDTAGSMMETVRVLKEFGAKAIYAGCTHGVLSGPAIERIQNSPIKELVITNTIPLQKEKQIPQIKVVSIAPLFAETTFICGICFSFCNGIVFVITNSFIGEFCILSIAGPESTPCVQPA